MNSSDWWAKEKECKDSEGNRLRSSLKFREGDDGPDWRPGDGRNAMFIDEDLGVAPGLEPDPAGILGIGC